MNGILKGKMEESSNSDGKIRGLYGELEQSRKQNSEYELRLTQITQEWQLRVKQYSDENDSLRRRMTEQENSWRSESEEYKRRLN